MSDTASSFLTEIKPIELRQVILWKEFKMKKYILSILVILFTLNTNQSFSQEVEKDTIIPVSLQEVVVSTPFKESLKNTSFDNQITENSLSVPLKEAREKFEKEYLTIQLKKFNGNISKTANFVGMERSALHRKLKGLGIKEFN